MNSARLPIASLDSDAEFAGRWWTAESDGRILCQLCPRACRLKDGDRGFCFVRKNIDGRMVLATYGKSTGFCIDPIEKKPLNHFLPGTPVLSFGTAGCNLGCKFCQNWDISKSREVARLSDQATPDDIAAAAEESGCRSVAFTYNDPVIWAEYAIDTATACRSVGIKSVAVTAGYITPDARREFFGAMDAANIDLKAFTEDFYYKLTGAHLDSVLDTIRFVVNETDCWVELTNLIIPDANDDGDELRRMCDWILTAVGDAVPVHFTAFHPDFRMRDRPRTRHETLINAFDVARDAGLKYVYVGNVHDVARQSTYCPNCCQLLIERDWHQLGRYALDGNRCNHCGHEIAGEFESSPGTWGQKRQPIRIESKSTSSVMETTKSIGTLDLPCIHQAACRAVQAVVNDQPFDVHQQLGELADTPISGIFVTLKRGETLRGCCGSQGNQVDLATALVESATRTAKHDPRMAPIAPIELPHLNVSVSVLGPPKAITATGDARADQVEIGKHGLRIRHHNKAGLLLPVVAKERNWNPRQFLDAVCTKAGLPPGAWRSEDAEVQIFDGIDYGHPMIMESDTVDEVGLFNDEELTTLRDWIQSNIVAFQAGAAPVYYAAEVPDRPVAGVVLNVSPDPQQPPVGWMQLSIRESMPLQSTLLKLTEVAAKSLRNHAWVEGWRADVATLSAIIHHGTDEEHDFSEVDCANRALIAMDGRRWATAMDPNQTPQTLLDITLDCQPFRAQITQIYSARCDSTAPSFKLSSGPSANTTVSTREPAVSGTFYPAIDGEREALVDQLINGLPSVGKRQVAAAMVPHAGLRFSGRIAADIWSRIDLPKTLLIIGPKHTNRGVDWAVAPHDRWKLSDTTSVAGDLNLARQIADSVPGMQLDADAHSAEHGIEVQLPLLHRIAPQTKITAIAISGGTRQELQTAAAALANVIKSLDQPPLLVISSDMNHFADDEENRRRDQLALDQLERKDPDGLLDVCQSENISMCGQLPAALVLWTLQALGQETTYDLVAYDTSASTSGDRSRVVGYAGVLF